MGLDALVEITSDVSTEDKTQPSRLLFSTTAVVKNAEVKVVNKEHSSVDDKIIKVASNRSIQQGPTVLQIQKPRGTKKDYDLPDAISVLKQTEQTNTQRQPKHFIF